MISYYLFDLYLEASETEVKVQENVISEYKWVLEAELLSIAKNTSELEQVGDINSGLGELEGIYPNQNGTGMTNASFQALKAIFNYK